MIPSQVKTIFVCIDWFYPAYKAGGPVVSILNLVENFNENVQYWIWCSDTDLGMEKLKNIEADKWVKYNEHTLVWYASKRTRSINNFRKLVLDLKPDSIFIIGMYSPFFNFIPMIFGKAERVILSPRGMLHPGSFGQKNLKKKIYIYFLKLLGVHNKLIFHATNSIEKHFIENAFGKKVRISIAENFPRKILKLNDSIKIKGILKLVTVALISPSKNYLNILEALSTSTDHVEYTIYGPIKEKNYWDQCLRVIKNLPENIIVKYRGETDPCNLSHILAENDVYIQPSKNENFGHSIFEALSAGKPVITSNGTPWNYLENNKAGLNVEPEDLKALNKAIKYFTEMDQGDFNLWQQGAIEYAENAVDFQKINIQYKEMFSV